MGVRQLPSRAVRKARSHTTARRVSSWFREARYSAALLSPSLQAMPMAPCRISYNGFERYARYVLGCLTRHHVHELAWPDTKMRVSMYTAANIGSVRRQHSSSRTHEADLASILEPGIIIMTCANE